MKRVIDISEEDYNQIEPFLNGEIIKGGFNLFGVLEIIKNSKPLSDCVEEAIASLQKGIPTPCRGDGKSTTHTLQTIALGMAIEAIEQTS